MHLNIDFRLSLPKIKCNTYSRRNKTIYRNFHRNKYLNAETNFDEFLFKMQHHDSLLFQIHSAT